MNSAMIPCEPAQSFELTHVFLKRGFRRCLGHQHQRLCLCPDLYCAYHVCYIVVEDDGTHSSTCTGSPQARNATTETCTGRYGTYPQHTTPLSSTRYLVPGTRLAIYRWLGHQLNKHTGTWYQGTVPPKKQAIVVLSVQFWFWFWLEEFLASITHTVLHTEYTT